MLQAHITKYFIMLYTQTYTNKHMHTHTYTHTHTQGLNKQSYEFFMMQNKSAYIFHNPAIQPTTIQNDYHVMFKIDHVTIVLL